MPTKTRLHNPVLQRLHQKGAILVQLNNRKEIITYNFSIFAVQALLFKRKNEHYESKAGNITNSFRQQRVYRQLQRAWAKAWLRQ